MADQELRRNSFQRGDPFNIEKEYTPNQLARLAGVNRKRLVDALTEVMPDWETQSRRERVFGNEARVLPPDLAKRTLNYLRTPPLSSVEGLYSNGYRTSTQLVQELGISKAQFFRFLNRLKPDWRETSLLIKEGQRRVPMLEPETGHNIKLLIFTRNQRQKLGAWRSLTARGVGLEELKIPNLEESLDNLTQLSMRDYPDLRQIYRIVSRAHRQISPDQEKDLITLYTRGRDADVLLAHFDIVGINEEEKEWLKKLSYDGKQALEAIIISNLVVVFREAWHYKYKPYFIFIFGQDFGDYFADAVTGLLDSLPKHDPKKGVRFYTYAKFSVRRKFSKSLGQIKYDDFPGEDGTEEDEITAKAMAFYPNDSLSDEAEEINSPIELAIAKLPDDEGKIIRYRFGINAPHLSNEKVESVLHISRGQREKKLKSGLASLKETIPLK